LSYSSKTTHIFLPSPDLSSHRVLQRFEAIREEVVLSLVYSSQEVRIVRERASPTTEGNSWTSVLLGIQLGEAFGSLDLHLYLVSWRHHQPHTLFYYMYSRSAPFCMRSAIIINKIRSEVFVAISCVTCLASC
jgi:hypothetical protein